ncbi:interferon alpha-inducible protein 27-like protein 2 [Pteronotus mesoamericanus]|uniref:interferon alpha-inducible protein 27-like protein 2 n=1 Tax=Pteronotus mesoamericanus TaxID=1884717 RepID=UPI0023EB8D7A|nr:interferon alpha-inducible protein 27-like protein 2 [Pteronotus parnellii mesoamericanus]XP_054423068.1 interferon alpha-inducible protein 27-like protein 2 [Pteronotus parnellii mesoamericanus]XP_054423069.1 interferon alpha-inducible protein 27-like protein 2 [Pteronotus parnellii mesoamericanus]XP_054423070.1 interferon alpha-inducible protein 27-like protein 2 [Pteronotus parnellii mesoamericanus]
MSAKAIENGEGFAADALLQDPQLDEEKESLQPSSAGSTPGGPPQEPPPGPDGPGSDSTDPPGSGRGNFSRNAKMAVLAATGGVVAVGAVPVVLGAMGFTGAGIAASSIAAKMMSSAAIANGGGVAAGTLVATLQSVGAAGLSASSNVLLGMTGSFFGAWMGYSKKADPSSPPGGPSGGDSQDGKPPKDKPPASQNCSEKDEK